MPKAIVLGAGMVGSTMAADLAADPAFDVTIADLRDESLERAAARCGADVSVQQADLSRPEVIRRLVQPHEIVLGALPSTIGFEALRAVIEAGRNICDICFMPEDARELDALARTRGVTAVVDCGVAPGMSHMLAGYATTQLDPFERLAIYVGGLPRERRWPFWYKAAFAPSDVLEEYTRPARLVEDGQVVVREALTEVEQIEFPDLGVLEAFNTDGLRSLVDTLDVPSMKEKTLRYPEHVEVMRIFRDAGLLGTEPITVGEATVRPIDFTGALLCPRWMYAEGEEDLTVMRVIAEGRHSGQPAAYQWDLFDTYDRASKTSSMSRTTALPCTATARLVVEGRFARPGVITPELIGQEPGLLDTVLESLAARGIEFQATIDRPGGDDSTA